MIFGSRRQVYEYETAYKTAGGLLKGYLIKGKKYETLRGTRRQVYEYETAYKTAGGLLKGDLVQNDKGRIVSKAKFDDGPNLLKNLTKRGFFTKKGKFGHTKMKTRKLRKKLTRKNRRKMKGGATITELKEQLGEVKKMIPNQIDEIKKNSAYEGAITLAGETGKKMFEDNLFAPLEELNTTFEKPIEEIETNIEKLEKEADDKLDDAKKELKTKIQENFDIIKENFKDTYKTAINEINKKLPPSSSINPPIILFFKFLEGIKEQLLKMINNKETDILKQIDELTPDDILKKAVETAENSIENATKNTEEGPADKDNEEKEQEQAEEKEENPTDKAVKDIIKNLTPEQNKEYEEQMKNAEINAVEQFASNKDAAELLEAQFKKETEEMNTGGKKKSKGKK